MKKILLPVFMLGLSATFVLSLSNAAPKKASAYEVSSLTTTIDLNDSSADEIRDYYSSLDSLSENERKGTNLLKNLKTILKKDQKYYSYDTSNLWAMYEITDRDWEKSPASDLNVQGSATYGEGKYDETTNVITDYKYGKSMSKHDFDPYIHALYVNRNVENQTTAWSDHGQTQWGINQEHIWPKSHGFENEGKGGARGDPMHLWAGNGRVNGTEHNNYFYGFVDLSKDYIDPVKAKGFSNLSGNYNGISLTLGANKVFEPQDSDKGDIARSIFYMVARYNYLAGTDGETIDSNDPNLTIVQESLAPNSGYQSTATKLGQMGVLTDLLAWHHLDPVDEYEIHRNNLLYKNYTNNRNPFIDYPEWVDYVWGNATYDSNNHLLSYDETPTGSANPASDNVAIITKELSLSHTSLKIKPNETAKIKATTLDNSDITWTVSDDTVVTLSKNTSSSNEEIQINALKEGKVTLTAKATVNGNPYEKTCEITVSNAKEEGGLLPFNLDAKTLIIIGVIAVVVIVLVIVFIVIYSKASKKQKKKMLKNVKKVTKKITKGSSSKNKKK